MSNYLDELEAWVAERKQRALSEQTTSQTNERFDRIEGAIGEMAKAVKTLADKSADVRPPDDGGNGGGSGAGSGGVGDAPNPAPPPPPETPPNLAVERVTRNTVPRVYSGDDEPETVTYIDADTGEEKQRPGRRKGQPMAFDVEVVPDTGEGGAE